MVWAAAKHGDVLVNEVLLSLPLMFQIACIEMVWYVG